MLSKPKQRTGVWEERAGLFKPRTSTWSYKIFIHEATVQCFYDIIKSDPMQYDFIHQPLV